MNSPKPGGRAEPVETPASGSPSGPAIDQAAKHPRRARTLDETARLIDGCLGPYAATMLDRTPQPILILDLAGRIVRSNRAFCDLLGYGPEALRGQPISSITPDCWNEATRRATSRMLADGLPLEYEKEYNAADGRRVPVALVTDIFRDEAGAPVGFIGFITNLTERKRAEQALRASEARFRHLFDEAPFGYHEIDTEGRIVEVNRAECELLGYSRDELIGRPAFDLLDDSQRDEARQAVSEKISGARPLAPFERILQRRDGQPIVVSIRERLRVSDDGRVLGLRSTVQDISEQKQMEAALVASEKRARALFEGIEDAVFVHDLEGRILDANPAASRLLGYSRAELLRLTTKDIDAHDFADGYDQRLERQLTQGHLSCEGLHRARDGRLIPVEINTSVIQLEDQTAVLAVIRDQTERQRMRAMLVQSEKLASIGLLSAGVAHEINNPLAYVANNLAVLERDLKGVLDLIRCYEEAADSLEKAEPAIAERARAIAEEMDWDYVRDNLGRLLTRTRDGVQRVASIVQNLRGIARTGPTKKETVAVSELIASALEMAQGQLKRARIDVKLDIPPGTSKVPCVANQITQVLLNLIINSTQAIQSLDRPDGGTLSIRVLDRDGWQIIELADDGPGISPEHLPKLFDPFFTTKPVGEGTGLGLAISHGIVNGHGGDIEVDSQPGHGSTFRITLPINA